MSTTKWNTAVLTAGCVLLGLILGITIDSGLAPPVVGEPWLKTYQGLIGAVVGVSGAILGLAVATYNVLRQMRINLMIREEDRMEDLLPSFLEARDLADTALFQLRVEEPRNIPPVLKLMGLQEGIEIGEAMPERLKDFDRTTMRELVKILTRTRLFAEDLHGAQVMLENIPAHLKQQRADAELSVEFESRKLESCAADLEAFQTKITQRIDAYLDRLPRFRREIEAYFAD